VPTFERLSGSLRRAPYVWLAVAILTLLVMNSASVRLAEEPGEGSNGLAVVGLALGLVGVAMWLFLHTNRARQELALPLVIVSRWLFAMVPFAFAWVTVAGGGEQWVIAFGLPASVVLLVISAVRTRREAADMSSTSDAP
jgi:hypothetical protein